MNSPQVPSAQGIADAQSKSNIATATAQTNLNAINQVTPTGSLTYKIIGTNPDGTPKYQATTALNAPTQQLLTSGQQGAQSLLDKINAGAVDPKTLSQQTQDQLDSLASQRLDPALQRQQASLEQELYNKGIKPGTEAWNNAMTLNSQSANDARNNLILSGYTTANQAALNQANLPFNQLATLMGNQQSGNIGTTPTPTSGVQGTNIAGLTEQQYQNQLAQSNSFNNALGSIGSTIGGWLFSDPDLKTDVSETGMVTAEDHIPVKTFRYTGSPMLNMGVMADDVEKVRPDAVKRVGGYRAVNYDAIKSPMLKLGVA